MPHWCILATRELSRLRVTRQHVWLVSKHNTLAQFWCDVSPPSTTLAQHHTNIGWTSHVCWLIVFFYRTPVSWLLWCSDPFSVEVWICTIVADTIYRFQGLGLMHQLWQQIGRNDPRNQNHWIIWSPSFLTVNHSASQTNILDWNIFLGLNCRSSRNSTLDFICVYGKPINL